MFTSGDTPNQDQFRNGHLQVGPDGSGTVCSPSQPCSLTTAQTAVRDRLAQGGHGAITVLVGDGTYRLDAPLRFGPADSGTPGQPVVWTAAPGAHPVFSGGVKVSGWHESDPADGIWSAPVPRGTATRQVYVDGQSAPVAQSTPGALGLDLSTWGAGGFTTSGSTAAWFAALASRIGPADVSGLQFVWNPMPPTDWEESECPVSSIGTNTITMAQPCWNNLTNKAPTIYGGNDSNITPYSLSPGTAPSSIENAYPLLHPGQWYLDQPTSTLYFMPAAGQRMDRLDVEVPRLQSLVQVTGTLAAKAHDLSFLGITFSTATWTQPSSNVGFPQVQGNLFITGANNQGECTFAAGPAGSCPWGGFNQPPGNVQLTAADDITFSADTFTDLGAVGLGIKYGSDHNLVQGNRFTRIASSAIWLGCGGDPDPANPVTDPPSAVIADCAADPALANDSIGTNEIMTGNTVDDNVIDNDASGYTGAAGVTLLFTQHTTVSHNDIFGMPYDGITSGAWEGHPDAANWNATTTIDADNTFSDNLFHNNMQSYGDGGDIYTEGHQGITVYNADGSINTAASYADGTVMSGNVTDTDTTHSSYAVAPDVGSQWETLTGNVEWNSHYSMSSHWPTADAPYTRSYGNWYADPDDTPGSPGEYDNTQIPETPGPSDLPLNVLASAGVQGRYQALEAAVPQTIYYTGTSPATSTTPARMLVAGTGFTPSTPVSIDGANSPHVQFVSPGFLVADIPACATDLTKVTLRRSTAPTLGIQPSATVVPPGGTVRLPVGVCDPTNRPLTNATVTVTAPSGWTMTPTGPTSLGTVAPHGTAATTFTATAPSSGLSGPQQFQATITFAQPATPGTQTIQRTTTVQSPFANLAASYDNVGSTDDTNTNPTQNFAGFDGEGTTYSAQGLAAAGLAPGATVTADGATLTWPNVAAGQPDNTMALGQNIDVGQSGHQLTFLTAANNSPLSGTVTIHYSDGSTSAQQISVGNFWWPAGQDGNPGNTQVASVNYASYPSGPSNHPVNVFATSIPLDPAKTVSYLTLPTLSDVQGYQAALHIFAMTVS